jgi:hypothetical protein
MEHARGEGLGDSSFLDTVAPTSCDNEAFYKLSDASRESLSWLAVGLKSSRMALANAGTASKHFQSTLTPLQDGLANSWTTWG